jgi:hypothetical protein
MRRLFAVAAIIIITPMIFGVSASVFSGETDTITEDVSLKPADGPNGDYAYLNDNDELVIDISETNSRGSAEGVPADEVTTLNNVFDAGYNGSQYAQVWITENSPAVTFRARGRQIQSQSNSVQLKPNETVSVGVQVDTVGRTSVSIDDITIHARVAEPNDITSTPAQNSDTTDAGIIDDNTEASVQTQSLEGDTREITIQDAGQESVTADPDPLVIDESESAVMTFESISASIETNQATMTVEDVSAPEITQSSQNVNPVGAVDITESGSGVISQASVRFSVSKSYLESIDTTADELVILHETESGWTQLDTEVKETRDGVTIIEADTSSFSMFVVAVETPQIVITDVTVSPSTTDQSRAKQVIVDVRNSGGADGRRTINLRDGKGSIATQPVTVSSDSSTTLQFNLSSDTQRFAEFGIRDVKKTTVVLNSSAKSTRATGSVSTTIPESTSPEMDENENIRDSTDGESGSEGDATVNAQKNSNTPSIETSDTRSVLDTIGLSDTIGSIAFVMIMAVIATTIMWRRRYR